jgi:hypothetical protein
MGQSVEESLHWLIAHLLLVLMMRAVVNVLTSIICRNEDQEFTYQSATSNETVSLIIPAKGASPNLEISDAKGKKTLFIPVEKR